MTLVPTDENKDKLKRNERIWRKIKDFIRSKDNNSDDYDEKFGFNSNNHFPVKKTLELHNIVIMLVFNEGTKFYPQIFLGGCVYILAE